MEKAIMVQTRSTTKKRDAERIESIRKSRRRSIKTRSIKQYVPMHVVFDILSRLSAKSLLRFQQVSRSWRGLIQDPSFIETHMNLSLRKRKILMGIFGGDDYDYGAEFYSIDEHGNATSIYSKFECPLFLNVASCNGLLAFAPTHQYEVIVCNPVAEGTILLPTPKFLTNMITNPPQNTRQRRKRMIGLGFDSCIKKYKVVAWDGVKHSTAEIFTLGTKSWRNITGPPKVSYRDAYHHPFPVYACGASHWYRYHSTRQILSFNFIDEKFGAIQVPEGVDIGELKQEYYALYEVGGRLCLEATVLCNAMVKIFVLTDYNRQEWVCQKIIFPSEEVSRFVSCIQDGELLIETSCKFPEKDDRCLYRYNERGLVTKVVRVRGMGSFYQKFQWLGENLVSLKDM